MPELQVNPVKQLRWQMDGAGIMGD